MVGCSNKKKRLVVFKLGGQQYAISSRNVERIIALAELERVPGAPKLLLGFLNLSGAPLPVLRLDRLFQLPESILGLWTPLIIVRCSKLRLALLVEQVTKVMVVGDETVLPLPAGHALNDCVKGIVRSEEHSVLVLSLDRLLLQQEVQIVDELQQLAQQRLLELQGAEG